MALLSSFLGLRSRFWLVKSKSFQSCFDNPVLLLYLLSPAFFVHYLTWITWKKIFPYFISYIYICIHKSRYPKVSPDQFFPLNKKVILIWFHYLYMHLHYPNVRSQELIFYYYEVICSITLLALNVLLRWTRGLMGQCSPNVNQHKWSNRFFVLMYHSLGVHNNSKEGRESKCVQCLALYLPHKCRWVIKSTMWLTHQLTPTNLSGQSG